MADLSGCVALVAGASRGAGRGVALALGDAGATVYVSARTIRGGKKAPDGAPGTIEDTAEEVTGRGGRGIAVQTDHTRERPVRSICHRIARDEGRFDILVNAVWGGNEEYAVTPWGEPFWEQPSSGWRKMMDAGVKSCLLTSAAAARWMERCGKGLIVHITDGPADDYFGQIYWDLSHQAINRLAVTMGREGRQADIAVIALQPGFMRTERVLMHLKTDQDKKRFGFERSESPEYVGRAVVALAADPARLNKSGGVYHVADLAEEYGFTDVDGRRIPRFEAAP